MEIDMLLTRLHLLFLIQCFQKYHPELIDQWKKLREKELQYCDTKRLEVLGKTVDGKGIVA